MLQVNGQGATSAGITALNNINAAAMNATRSKMNSTMMVKFNSHPEKALSNQRSNLNKSTLLPSNMVGGINNPGNGAHLNTITQSRNPNIKMNLNIALGSNGGAGDQVNAGPGYLDHNMQ